MKKIGVVCDCHNTLINSNLAWIRAFTDFAGEEKEEEIKLYLYGKIKRRELARKYNIEFSLIEKRADIYEKAKQDVLNLLESFNSMGVPLFVVSNAPSARVLKDLEIVNIRSLFNKIYTGDDGGKKNLKIFDEILKDYHLDYILFIGNEEFDDNIPHPRVLSVVITSFLRERFQVVAGYNFDQEGKIKIKESVDE